ncbi:SLATT domain-containing protein [Halomonas urmiana]|uniref:SLATT domain-containing protein n=1 Tax=Halomonas urmiana TaxID=490901 RepID=UPI00130528D5|nr:SLATT domain-containing protein [Halomonas urmiana]
MKIVAKKTDIKIDELGVWKDYLGIAPDDASKKIYESAIATSKKAREWYWVSKNAKKYASLIIRSASFSLLVLGVALPLFAGMSVDAQESLYLTQSGVAALAVAGLLQAADRIFGWSSGWLRYVATVTEMEAKTHKFILDWTGYTIKKDGPLNELDKCALYEMGRSFVDGILKLQNDETNKWISDFNSSVALLNDLIKSQRLSSEKAQEELEIVLAEKKKIEEEAEKANLPGGLEVNIKHKDSPMALKIGIDDEQLSEFVGRSWTKESIQPGQHTVRVLIEQPKQEIRRLVKILPDEIATIDIHLG